VAIGTEPASNYKQFESPAVFVTMSRQGRAWNLFTFSIFVMKLCRGYSWPFAAKIGTVWLGLYDVSTMLIRLFTIASSQVKNTLRMPQDLTRNRLDCFYFINMSKLIVLNMSTTVWSVCRCSNTFQEVSKTTTIAERCHHWYIRSTSIVCESWLLWIHNWGCTIVCRCIM
jgi:hypothetical protein